MTSGTYGPIGITSSASAVLESSLVNRLRATTDLVGSTLFRLTWKVRTTPAGRSIAALRASALRISGKDSGSWPTPIANDGKKGAPPAHMGLAGACTLAFWPTPMASNSTGSESKLGRLMGLPGAKKTQTGIVDVAILTNWATASARDWKDSPGMATERPDGCSRLDMLPRQASLTSWATTRANDARSCGMRVTRGRADTLTAQVGLVGPARLTVSGKMLIGSSAGMDDGGQLSPGLPRWLMALPAVWDVCGVTAMQSTQRRRKQ